jgi:hypothetical protein
MLNHFPLISSFIMRSQSPNVFTLLICIKRLKQTLLWYMVTLLAFVYKKDDYKLTN